jgi:hypothetical protein
MKHLQITLYLVDKDYGFQNKNLLCSKNVLCIWGGGGACLKETDMLTIEADIRNCIVVVNENNIGNVRIM